ncbi:MAG: type II toxin-antitoxin system prevent-host-death family antitoxin [Chlorobiaceae bacterium]|nr:type II toxin-antitoxin system prevent-host-death family antitoxin [Chlorobiaceae bacterium]
MRATAKELKFNSKKLIDSVNRGEEVIITFRGKPCAKLVPYQEIKKQTERNELFGMWENNEMVKNVDEYVRGLRKGRFR